MTVGSFAGWIARRGVCTLVGHDWRRGRVWSGRQREPVGGHVCDRCAATTEFLPRWAR